MSRIIYNGLNGSTALVTSNLSGHGPSLGIDGYRHTRNSYATNACASSGNPASVTQVFTHLFNALCNIDVVRLYNIADAVNYNTDPTTSDTFSLYGNEDWTVELLQSDNTTWTNIGTVTGNNKVLREFPFTAGNYRGVRWSVTKAKDANVYIVESEAEGDAPDTTPPTDCEIGMPTVLSASSVRVPISTASTDARSGMKDYYYEIDTQSNFLSGSKITGHTANTASPFDISGLTGNTLYYVRFKGRDNATAPNLSTNFSSVRSFTTWIFVPPPPVPVIIDRSPLPYARIGRSYTYQFSRSGGSGTGSYSVTLGNLPNGSVAANGKLTIPNTGNGNYTFTLRYDDADGDFVEKSFTIPVSDLAVWSFGYKFPLQIEHNKTVRIFKPRRGPRQTRTDTPLKRKITIDTRYFERSVQQEILSFYDEHYPAKNFLFFDSYKQEYFEAYISTALTESKNCNYGDVEFVIEEV